MVITREKMRSDWDERAKKGSLYVAPSKSLEEFRESGRIDTWTILSGLPSRNFTNMTMLDVGCGLGRIEEHLSSLVGEVHGIDVSLSMINQAKENVSKCGNVFLHLGSGHDLAQFRAETFDLVFSYVTFQHIPRKIFLEYLPEMWRVLKHGGMINLQVLSLRIPKWVYVWLRRAKNQTFKIEFEPPDDDTWSMRFYTRAELLMAFSKAGFENIKIVTKLLSRRSIVSVSWITAEKRSTLTRN
jgi:ubiquinone/menaquinone biosynthesis C-methylase UbiE